MFFIDNMVKINYKINEDSLYIGNFENNQEDVDARELNTFSVSSENLWNFIRSGSNNAYLHGNKMSVLGDSYNNLVFSSSGEIVLDNIKNSFIYVSGDKFIVRSIFDMKENSNLISRFFKPKAVIVFEKN